ncbi:MAG: ATP-cone domain protein [Candidatus Collierbacteria bacterium GW2011_GWF2_44_15]|uniref:ATP-cone domain protein n=4 Tax=Candidatus Collieribacteriota TaxID=1752725 RepID=A0A0G1HF59_9BACT|nr:MAG: ATP-cone domain protein [Candidatus Collierbacteria bacterium GW2011_GWF2_44_15]KKU28833.1 MAG: ATP-cone domain protein [Candidatus Collierbacteria bacterium GW2011_GWE1_46_18]
MQTVSPYQVIKASGEKEDFSEEKIVKSLAASGMNVDTAAQTLDYLKRHVKPGITTHEIFGQVSGYLKETSRRDYINYGLKRAFMRLGPSGHPFERYMGDLLEKFGYETQVSVSLGGECVTHEIDCIAVKGDQTSFIECKYHNAPGTKTDVQVVMYTYARFLDIEKSMKALFDSQKTYQPWVVTNTKLTFDAINYAKCIGIKATAWSFPKDECLHEMIVNSGLHPVTVIDTLTDDKLQRLLERDIVTCFRLMKAIENESVSDILTPTEIEHAKEDIQLICKNNG